MIFICMEFDVWSTIFDAVRVIWTSLDGWMLVDEWTLQMDGWALVLGSEDVVHHLDGWKLVARVDGNTHVEMVGLLLRHVQALLVVGDHCTTDGVHLLERIGC